MELHGVAIDEGVAATPDEVHFGTMAAGMTTAINEVQLTNCSTAELMFDRVYIAGADADEYTLIGANPSRTLAAGESEVFMVVMQPKTNGFKIAQLVAEHAEGKTVVALDGTGEGADDKERETYYSCSTGRSSRCGRWCSRWLACDAVPLGGASYAHCFLIETADGVVVPWNW